MHTDYKGKPVLGSEEVLCVFENMNTPASTGRAGERDEIPPRHPCNHHNNFRASVKEMQ